jgi:hypothetical protein
VLRSACFVLRSSFRGRFVGFVTLRPKSTQPLRPRRSAIRRSEFFVLPAACCVRRSFTPLHRINGRRRRPSLCHLELRFIRLPRDTRRCKQFPPEILDFRKKPPQTKLERRTQNALLSSGHYDVALINDRKHGLLQCRNRLLQVDASSELYYVSVRQIPLKA